MFGDEYPVSATATGMAVGSIIPGIGTGIGALVGMTVDLVRIGLDAKKKEKKIKKEFYKQLLIRYNSTVFITALERLGPAMEHVVNLGFKPGTDDFESMLTKKLNAEIGYRGNCGIDLYGPASSGQARPLLAKINGAGAIETFSPFFKPEHGPQWAQVCKELHLEALKQWGELQAEKAAFERELQDQQATASTRMITEILVNGSLILLTMGYNLKLRKDLNV